MNPPDPDPEVPLPATYDTRLALQRGLNLLQDGQTGEGLGLLADVAAANPNHGPARLFHGIALWDHGDVPGAESEFEATRQIEPKNHLAASFVGLCHLAQGRTREARACWQPYGHPTNLNYRIRLTEWIEEGFLRANGWPHLEPPAPPIPAESETPGVQTENPEGEHPPETVPVSRPHWDPWIYAPAEELAPDFLNTEPQRLSWFQHGRLERLCSSLYYSCKYGELCRAIPPLLRDSRVDSMKLWVAATAAELTGHSAASVALCERITPQEEWPDAIRSLYGRGLYRLGRHQEAAQQLALIQVRGPEDYGIYWALGGLALAQQDRQLARRMFHRSHSSYMVDTLINQWWSVERALERWDGPAVPHTPLEPSE